MSRAPAVELAGYLGAAGGVGEAARRYLGALRSVGVPVLERDVPLPGRDAAGAELPLGRQPASSDVLVNLLCLNPEQMVPYLDADDTPGRQDRAIVGVWSWEVDVVPAGWRDAGERLAEVWTYSSFAARLIRAAVNVPVVAVPPPISTTSARIPLSIDLPQGFRVLVMFDYLSTLQRKNPLGAIEAFRTAFEPTDGAILVIKSINARHRPERHAELSAAIAGRPDAVLVDETMSAAERDALIDACDCYLSLHRSEGHGLPLAEAMSIGKPVVATAYGGNMEFMSEANSYPVPWTPVPVGEGVEHYPTSATWAEPDVKQAARVLRELRSDPERGRGRALQGQADVQALLAPEVVGALMRDRLERLSPAAGIGPGRRLARRLAEKSHRRSSQAASRRWH
jgi:glycosyltransferase involved in cell wall biosynthesis